MTDKLRPWGELTDQEQGALLLAHHRGEEIEYFGCYSREWNVIVDPAWRDELLYRVKPKPVVETVTLYGRGHPMENIGPWIFHTNNRYPADKYRLTLTAKNDEFITGVFTDEDDNMIKLERIDDHE